VQTYSGVTATELLSTAIAAGTYKLYVSYIGTPHTFTTYTLTVVHPR
jgi:glycine betaine/choline ABC-type transport system substrate-binding protein